MARGLGRLLSLGVTPRMSEREARHTQVSNALALLGVVLVAISVPIDVSTATLIVVAGDLVSMAWFALVWVLNARGRCHAARIVLVLAANIGVLAGAIELGGSPELRTMFLPLVLLPYLVFDVTARGYLVVSLALPIAAYFTTAAFERDPILVAEQIYEVYAPLLAFVMLIAGVYLFARIDRSASERVAMAHARAAQGARLVALGEMASGIAHEIRNPLAAIHMAATQIAAMPDHPEQVAALGTRIQRITMRASKTIDALRSFSRDAGGDPFVTVPLERVIGDALELCGKRLDERGVTLDISAVPKDLAIECRPVQLTQVLVNLLVNALDAVSGAPDARVTLDVRETDDHIELGVTDSGPGIPADVRARLFEPFFTTKAPDRGTGLGLSLSRGLVQSHGGTLELDAQSPRTRFVITLLRRQPGDRA